MKTNRFSMLVSAILSAALLVSLLILGTQTVAWFKNFEVVTDEAEVTNFITTTEYRFGDSGEWIPLSAGEAIPITPTVDVNTLKLRISYQGESAAFVRTMISGSFNNKYTGTVLPQPDRFWSLSGDNWTTYQDYTYYTKLLQKASESDDASTATVELKQLEVLSVTAALNTLGDISEYQDYAGELYVIVDAVQPDRYDEIWNVTTTTATAAN